jgi:hypothetical protein
METEQLYVVAWWSDVNILAGKEDAEALIKQWLHDGLSTEDIDVWKLGEKLPVTVDGNIL